MSETFDVPSKLMWIETPIRVEVGDVLSFKTTGHWVDAVIPCSANGYPAPFFYALHEYPRIRDDGRYFRLMGRISTSGAGAFAFFVAQDQGMRITLIPTEAK